MDNTKRIAITIVAVNINFSGPRLVRQDDTESELPNAPPAPASEYWIKIAIISSTDKPICIYGSTELRDDMWVY